jgi:hypothetical protein
MKNRTTILGNVALLLLMLTATAFTCLGQNEKAPGPAREKKGGISPRMYHQPCFPATVSAITGGSFDPGAFVSELTIKSNSPKPIKAVILGWYVYDDKTSQKIWNMACGDKPIEQRPVLSGQTQLIELGRMLENQTFNVGTAPRIMLWPADVTVFVKTPLIMMSDFISLSTDGTRQGLRDIYGMIIAVREVHFEDGTKWVAEGEPPYMKPTK